MLIIAGMAAVIFTGCQRQDEVTETLETEPSYVLADLALSLPPSPAGTRLDLGVTSGGDVSSFRGISSLSIIPFTKQGKIVKSDKPSIIVISNPLSEDFTPIHDNNKNELYRYYEKVFLNRGVASFLTYGQGDKTTPANTSGLTDKVFYGSLIPKVAGEEMTYIPNRLTVTAGDLSFELETIYNEIDETTGKLKAPDESLAIADYLTYVANSKVTVGDIEYSWSKSNQINETLMGLYRSFINYQGPSKYGVIAGSAANVKAYVNELYKKLQDLRDNDSDFGADQPAYAIADEIQSRILAGITQFTVSVENKNNQVTITSFVGKTSDDITIYDNYPSRRHLPDGSAVLQWGKKSDNTYGFIPQIQTTNTANVSSMNRYTYPAELYYYGNSLIKTSDDEVPVSSYSGKPTWKDVVDDLYKSGSVVSYNTKALAIEDPLQYAVARLQGTVWATSSTLNDADNTLVSLTNGDNDSFPITGLIVSGQYPVNFDFTPKLDGASEDNEHFVYDCYLGSNSLSLTTTESSPFYTMVMQTHDYEDVTIILEFENNSGTDFVGENGIVFNGTKFYLAGKVELSKGNANGVDASERDDVSNRVFTQDHTTVISMKVSSLAKAYNVMPNIQSGRLEVGVEINLKWEQATPITIEFEE